MTNYPGAILLVGIIAGIVLFWPGHGLFWRLQRYRELSHRVQVEDALKHFHQCAAVNLVVTIDSLSGALQLSRAQSAALVAELDAMGLVQPANSYWELTPPGCEYALRIVRAHRLLEVYLAEQTGLAETDWHSEADRREHFLTTDEVDALAAEMGYPRYDPHGDPIPTASGEIAPARGVALTTIAAGQGAVVVHVEDEPETVYEQLTAQGFSVGIRLAVLEVTSRRIRVEVEGDERILAPIVAANLSVVPFDERHAKEQPLRRLADIQPGESACVVKLSPACRGMQRRRLFDLGLIPGTVVRAEFRGPGGDPTAYDIRGAVIALRRRQAEQILVEGEQPQSRPLATVSSETGP